MSKLILHGEDGGSREYLLDRERITIGRKASNDIQLDDSAVSGNHAVIITLGSDSFLEDLESTNGTRVNHKDAAKCVLHDGDEIKIARYKFTFVGEAEAQSAPGITISATPAEQFAAPHAVRADADLDADTIMPDLTEVHPSSTLGTPVQADMLKPVIDAAGGGTLGQIRILAGPGMSQRLELTKPATTLGKPGMQVAVITQRDGHYYLGMVEGDELPLLNGTEMKSLPCQLQHQDVIEIAGIQLEFTLR